MQPLCTPYRLVIWLVLVCSTNVQQVLASPHDDTASINHLIDFADSHLNPDTALIYFHEALARSKAVDYPDGAFRALIIAGIKYFEKEDYATYRRYSEQAIPWAERSTKPDNVAWAYINIGESFFFEGDYLKASEYYYKGLEDLKRRNAPITHTTVNIYNSLGQVRLRLGQVKLALEYFQSAENMAREVRLPYQLALSLIYQAEYYISVHSTDSAIRFYNEVKQIGRSMGKVDLMAMSEAGLGKAYTEAGKYELAVPHLEAAIGLSRNHFNDIVLDASYALGDIWYHQKKYVEAESIIRSALSESVSHNIKDAYTKGYSKLERVYRASGQYQAALMCMDTLAALKDSLTSIERTKAIHLMEVKYNTAEKDKLLAQNQLLIARQNNKISRKNLQIISTVAGLLLLLAAVVAIVWRNRQRRYLEAQRIKTLQQQSQIDILQAMAESEDRERARIAAELHDGVGGMLSASMMRLRAIKHEFNAIEQIPAYQEGMEILGRMGNEIRETSHNLMPDALLRQTLPEAVETFCNYMQDKGNLHIDFQSFGDFSGLQANVKIGVYRVIQELLKNIRKHAEANHALVELQVHEGVLAVTVEDNGKGFSIDRVNPGLGLRNIQTRINSLNGTYTLQSEPGSGTSVYIEIDLT